VPQTVNYLKRSATQTIMSSLYGVICFYFRLQTDTRPFVMLLCPWHGIEKIQCQAKLCLLNEQIDDIRLMSSSKYTTKGQQCAKGDNTCAVNNGEAVDCYLSCSYNIWL